MLEVSHSITAGSTFATTSDYIGMDQSCSYPIVDPARRFEDNVVRIKQSMD